MNTPKTYKSVSRIGVTAEFKAFSHCPGSVESATFNFHSIRSFFEWVKDRNNHVAYVTLTHYRLTEPKLCDHWSRSFISPYLNTGWTGRIIIRLKCGAIGHLTFHKA